MSTKLKEPKLRFQEFSGEWKEKQLGRLATFLKGKGISKTDIDENGKTECIRYGELYTQYNELIENIISKTDVDTKDLVLSEYGDIIIPASGETQIDIATASCVLKDNIAIGGDLNIIKTKEDGVFLSYYLNNAKKFDIAKLSQGISVVHLYGSQLKTLKLNLPSKQEQEKIASFLSSVDRKIEQLTKYEELFQQYKKGVMQKIFNQEIRFKKDDGNSFPQWQNFKLSRFLVPTLREILKPQYKYLAIGIRSHCKGTFQKPNSDPDKIAMDKLYLVKENDLIVNITFAWEGAIAIVKKEDENGLVSHRFPTYTFKETITNFHFFQYIIIQKKFRYMLDLISPGGAGRNRVMSKKDFLQLKWKLPCIEEQTKIASFLSSIDSKIEKVQSQLKLTKEFKKGLLQRMFV